MTQRVVTILEDDIDGSEATETVQFALDGTAYEIDLNDKHAKALRERLSTYVQSARKTGASKRKRSRSSGDGPQPAVIRDWARGQGIVVPSRGRIPREVREAFEAA